MRRIEVTVHRSMAVNLLNQEVDREMKKAIYLTVRQTVGELL